jgi:hypothetical protein
VTGVWVKVDKPHPPAPMIADSAGVELLVEP